MRTLALVAICVLTSSSGCRGWQGDRYLRHRAPASRARKEATYAFGLPGGGWQPIADRGDLQVAWLEPDLGAVIELHAQCADQGDSSLEQYTDHLRMDWTKWTVVSQVELKLERRAALRTVVDAELDGVPRRNDFVVVKKDGCLFDLRYSAPPDGYAKGHAAFDRVVGGFRFPLVGA